MLYLKRAFPTSFYARPTLDVARDLLGQILVRETASGGVTACRIVEVEAYLGQQDPASHAYRGPTPRASIMFGPAGKLYVYLSYGMHFCMNAVAHEKGRAGAVLLRAGEPVAGLDEIRRRRAPIADDRRLARGPACLTKALGITREDNGADLARGLVRIHESRARLGLPICESPRIGISRAVENPWRFFYRGHPSVSGSNRLNRGPITSILTA